MTFELYNASLRNNINIVSGQKLCPMYRNKLSVREQSETDSRNLDVSDKTNYMQEIHCIEQDQQEISECFQSVAISPLNTHVQPLSGRFNLGKENLTRVSAKYFFPVSRFKVFFSIFWLFFKVFGEIFAYFQGSSKNPIRMFISIYRFRKLPNEH